jgi:UDP-N-acetylmuramyl pentapeptide phosphotransferase/UDP-N-acetylglucosamine-1-phosphate transferase
VTYLLLLALAAASLMVAWAATGAVTSWLARRAILDHPSPRGSHDRPTPRGGGLGLLAGLAVGWGGSLVLLPGADPIQSGAVLAGIVGLAALSFVDDLRGLPVALRLAAQAVAVGGVLAALPDDALVFQGWLPTAADRLLTGLAWLWFVNLFNFMDGIDGISGVEAASIGAGGALVAWLVGSFAAVGLGLTAAAAALGFLVWNWHPARVFLGDVGSIPLGFALGWLMIGAALDGAWAVAVILPAYYWTDATLTLLLRLGRGEAVWRPHRGHFYQHAVQHGMSHADVARQLLSANLALIALAYLSTQAMPWLALALTIVPVASLIRRFARAAPLPSAGSRV